MSETLEKPDGTWLPVPGYEGLYEVSDRGMVWSIPRPRTGGGLLKPGRTRGGYKQVALCKDGKQKSWKVAVLVAVAFLGPRPVGLDVCHGDGNNQNDSAGNLRYGPRGSNIHDQVLHGTHNKASLDACARCGGPLTEVPGEGRRRCARCTKNRANDRQKRYYQRNRQQVLLKKYPGRLSGSGCQPGCTCGRHTRSGKRKKADDAAPQRRVQGAGGDRR